MNDKRKMILTYIMLMFLLPVVLTIGLQVLSANDIIPSISKSKTIMYANMTVYLFLPVAAIMILHKRLSSDLKKTGGLLLKIIPLILIVYASSMLGNLFVGLLDHTQTTDNQTLINELRNTNSLFTAYMAAFAAPIAEESVFRYSIIADRKGFSSLFTLILSSALFGLIHTQGFTLGAFLAYAVIGFTLGCIYLKYRNLVFNILVHAGYNGSALLLSYLMSQYS